MLIIMIVGLTAVTWGLVFWQRARRRQRQQTLPTLLFSSEAKAVFDHAMNDARTRGQCVGPEHLLAALTSTPPGAVADALRAIGVDASTLHARALLSMAPAKDACSTEAVIPLTASSEDAMVEAIREASERLHSEVNTEDLLVGLLRTRRNAASKALAESGATLPRVRQAVAATSRASA